MIRKRRLGITASHVINIDKSDSMILIINVAKYIIHDKIIFRMQKRELTVTQTTKICIRNFSGLSSKLREVANAEICTVHVSHKNQRYDRNKNIRIFYFNFLSLELNHGPLKFELSRFTCIYLYMYN